MNKARFRRVVLQTHRRRGRVFPWRETSNPYEVLVGEVLLQRTRGENAVEVYRRFLERWPDEQALAGARPGDIAAVIRPLGFVKRAPLLKALGEALVRHGGVPMEPEELLRLPGVGRYAAYAVPVFAGDRDLPLVDWVIARVLCRYFGLPSGRRPNTDERLWVLAAELAAKGKARELWLGTLDFAASVCKKWPLCPECPLQGDCVHYQGS